MAKARMFLWNRFGDARWRLAIFIALGVLLCTDIFAASQEPKENAESYIARAVEAQSAGNLQEAISAYKKAVILQPGLAEVWSNLGLMQHQAGDIAGALDSFMKAHRLKPKLFVPVLFLGLENLQQNKPAEALPYLQTASRLQPEDANVLVALGRAYFGMAKFENAADVFTQATKLNPGSGDAWYRLGITQFKMAEQSSRSLSARNRKSPFFLALEGDALGSQDRLNQAAEIYGEVLQSQMRPPCIRSALGFVLLRQGKEREADTQFRQDVQDGGCSVAQLGLFRIAFKTGKEADLAPLVDLWGLDPGFMRTFLPQLVAGMTSEQFAALNASFDHVDSSEAISAMKAALHGAEMVVADNSQAVHSVSGSELTARTSYRRGEYRRCVDQTGLEISSPSREDLTLLSACAFFTGDFDRTLSAAARLRNLKGNEDEGLYWSIRAYQGLGVRSLVRAGVVEPQSVHLHELLAETYRDLGRYQGAEAEYAALLENDPNNFAALFGAAATYLQEYRLEQASEMIRRAIALRPSDPEANYIAGEILIDQRQFDAAEPLLRIGLSAKPELVPRVHALLGRVYANRGEDLRAIEELRKGLSSDDDGSIHFQLGRLYQKIGQAKLAEVEFGETRKLQSSKQNVTH